MASKFKEIVGVVDQDSLVLGFEADSDGTGKLLASVRVGDFAGSGGAWFDISQVEKFAGEIAKIPISNETRPAIAGGFWKKDTRGELSEEHLALTVYPVGGRGHVGVQVRLATELWDGDRPESQSAVKLELLTTYQHLGEFAQQLRFLVRGRNETAILEADSP